MFEIDLPLLSAQLVTFLIGTFLLWKIAWKPLVEMLRQRQEMISKNITDAQGLKTEAEQLKNEYAAHMGELEKKAAGLLQQSKENGELQKKEILQVARSEARGMIETAKKQMEEERENLKKELKRDMVPLAVSMAEKILKETLTQETQHRIVRDFMDEFSKKN
jgi:F-type H+-transporting ATPase subunit b